MFSVQLDSQGAGQTRPVNSGKLLVECSVSSALRHWSPVHVHAGAADISARVAILEGGSIAPGGERLAQIILQAPASLLFGERIIKLPPV